MVLSFAFAADEFKGGIDLVKALTQGFKLIWGFAHIKMTGEIAVMDGFDKLAYLVLRFLLEADQIDHLVNNQRYGYY